MRRPVLAFTDMEGDDFESTGWWPTVGVVVVSVHSPTTLGLEELGLFLLELHHLAVSLWRL